MLPELTAPPGVPAFKASGHSFSPEDLFASFKPRTGHPRKRRKYTEAQATATVEWWLTQAQMEIVNQWAEVQLNSYNDHFSAYIANIGAGYVWFEAQWLQPFSAEPAGGGRWLVRGTLLLFGNASDTGPVSTSLALDIAIPLASEVSFDVSYTLSLDIVVPLQNTTLFTLAIVIPMDSTAMLDALKREDGTDYVREDGTTFQRE